MEPIPDSDANVDTVFDVLAHRRRRDALGVLVDHENPMTLADLADEVAVREHDTRIDDIPADDVMELYLSLYHAHVPKLAAAGCVRYDQEHDLIALCADDERVDVYRALFPDG